MMAEKKPEVQKILVRDLDAPPVPAQVSAFRLVITLALAGFISGVLIIGIYELTLPTITANKAEALRQAVFKVLPGVTQMQKMVAMDGHLQVSRTTAKGEKPIYAGFDKGGRFVGYAVPGEGAGFQDTIKILFGFNPDKRQIVGMQVLESRETPGLGDKIYKDAHFMANFDALSVDPKVLVVKKGMKTEPNQVDAITGATISSKAMVKIINETNGYWLPKLPEEAPALSEVGSAASDSAAKSK